MLNQKSRIKVIYEKKKKRIDPRREIKEKGKNILYRKNNFKAPKRKLISLKVEV